MTAPLRHRRCQPWLGTFVEVTLDAPGDVGPLFDAAFDAIAEVHRLMNAHDACSCVGRINAAAAGTRVAIDPLTRHVIERALFWAALSEGAFDPTQGAWRAMSLGRDGLRIDRPARLDLGGIAKGFAVDRAVAALQAAGAVAGLVNAGGDMVAFGPEPWPVDIVDPATRRPLASMSLENEALATSAGRRGAARGLDFSHLPGRAAAWLSVSVQAPCAIDADALTKIMLAGGGRVAACLAAGQARALAIDRRGNVRPIGPGIEAVRAAA